MKDKKKNSTPVNNINEINVNYINLNYVNEIQQENSTKYNNNLAYMKNISNLMKKIELNKSKNKNQYPYKYYNKKETKDQNIERKEKKIIEDESKREIKSYQFLLNIEERKLDPEDVIEIKKHRFSSIPAGFHLNQRNTKLQKKVI